MGNPELPRHRTTEPHSVRGCRSAIPLKRQAQGNVLPLGHGWRRLLRITHLDARLFFRFGSPANRDDRLRGTA